MVISYFVIAIAGFVTDGIISILFPQHFFLLSTANVGDKTLPIMFLKMLINGSYAFSNNIIQF
jgi:hypothetical protein